MKYQIKKTVILTFSICFLAAIPILFPVTAKAAEYVQLGMPVISIIERDHATCTSVEFGGREWYEKVLLSFSTKAFKVSFCSVEQLIVASA